MKKLLKIFSWIAGIFLAVMILLVIGLYLFFPLEKVKQLAVEKGSEQLGREIKIGGAEISIWGGVGVKLNDVVISSPSDDFEKDFLKAVNIDVKLQLMPIFSGEYRIDRLIINKPEIYLKKERNGRSNFSFQTLEKKVPPSIADKTPEEAKPALAAISFDNFEINDAVIDYFDDSSGIAFSLKGMNLSSHLSMPQQNIYYSSGEINIHSLIIKTENPLPDYSIQLNYDAEYDFKKDNLGFNISKLGLNKYELSLTGTVADIFKELTAEINLKAEDGSIKELLTLLPLEYSESYKKNNLDGDLSTSLALKYDKKSAKPLSYSGDINISNGNISLEEPYESIDNLTLSLGFDESSLKINKFEAETKSSSLSFNGNLHRFIEYLSADSSDARKITPEIDANFKGDMNLAYLVRYLPPKGNPQLSGTFNFDLNLTGPLDDYLKLKPEGILSISNASYNDSLLPEPIESFNTNLTISPDTIEVTQMNVAFTSSDASFSGKLINPFPYLLPLENIDRSKVIKPTFLFSLSSQRFDFDRLFPEAVPGSGENQTAVITDSISFIILPDINGKGKFKIDTMIYSKVEFANIKGDIRILDRKIECYNVNGNVYTGKVTGNTTIDLNDFTQPVYSGEFQADAIEANDFMSRFSKFKDYLYGKIDLKGSYNAVGWEPEAFLNSLSMTSTSNMQEGKLITKGAVYSMMSGLAKKMNQPFEKEQPLKNLTTNIVVKDGKVSMDKFKTKLGDFGDLEVDGFYSFNDEISYQGTILLTKEQTKKLLSNKGLLGDLSSFLNDRSTERIKLPLSIGGTIDKPKIEIDYSSLMKDVGKNLTKDAGNLLKNLFKKKKK